MSSSSDIGPVTYGSTPQDVYNEFEKRQVEVQEAMPLFEKSLQVVSQTSVDSTLSKPSQLDQFFAVKQDAKDTDIGPPPNFSTNALFTRQALMTSFGPPSHQEDILTKLSELALTTKNPEEEKQVEQMTRFVEEVQNLNLIRQEIYQEQDRIGKA